MRYRRSSTAGGTYFFTVNLAQRKSDVLVRNIDVLRAVLGHVKSAHPFAVVAMVMLPEHLHAIWRLPPGDADYPMRWSLIKAGFSRRLNKVEPIGASRKIRGERGIWQRRYWEHQIRDETDLAHHVDYIHYNPVKHGLVTRPVDWPHSTLHGYIERKLDSKNWGVGIIDKMDDYGER
jgi:putative transposase